jgi:DNA polymerase-3 subunit epsilon
MRYIVGDVETSSLANGGVCEIAWVEVDEDLQVLERVHSLIDPECRISAAASGIHGITNLDVADAPTLREFFEIIRGEPIVGDSVLVGHNIAYDRPFFAPYMPELRGTLCTLRLARKLLPMAENHRLQTLMFQFELRRNASHRADGDVDTCLSLLELLVQASGQTLPELMAEAAKPILVEKWPFGKHKDKPLGFDMGYVDWALKNMKELDSDLKWSLEQVKAGRRTP